MIRMLDKVLRRSDAVDKESLCVLAGQRVRLRYRYGLQLLIDFIGVASKAYDPLSGGCRKFTRLCMLSRDCGIKTLQAA